MILTTGAENTPETANSHGKAHVLFPPIKGFRIPTNGRTKILKSNSNQQIFMGLYHTHTQGFY